MLLTTRMYSLLLLTILGNISLQGFVSARTVVNGKLRDNSGSWNTLDKMPSKLMAHRGEKVLMPEHTVGSYEVASIEGADYVEPDLVLTKDGHLVCYHDLTIKSGTDLQMHPEFEHLKTLNYTGDLDGINKTVTILNDWFIKDFTLAELQTLRVKQANKGIRPQLFNNVFHIPTFEEYLNVIHEMAAKQNRSIGVIPELKHPLFHNSHQSANYMENKVLEMLGKYGYPVRKDDVPACTYDNSKSSNSLVAEKIECGHVIIQCFDIRSLKYLKTETDIDLLMLADADYASLLTYDGVKEVASVAQHFSVWKELLHTGIEAALEKENIPYDKEYIASLGGFVPAKELVSLGHSLNLKMGLFTIYDSHEKSNRGCDIVCDPENKEKELFYYFDMGVDGLFVENVQEAMELRLKYDYNLQMDIIRNSANNFMSHSPMHLLLVVSSVVFCTRFIW